MCYGQPLIASQNQCQAMRSNAKQWNPMSFCCICYLSVLCIICGPKSLWWPPGGALCYLLFRLLLHVLGWLFGTFLDASVQFLLHLFFSGSPFGACFLKDLLDTCLKFLLHSVPDPPRERKASVTHDPKRVMCYDQLLRACLS